MNKIDEVIEEKGEQINKNKKARDLDKEKNSKFRCLKCCCRFSCKLACCPLQCIWCFIKPCCTFPIDILRSSREEDRRLKGVSVEDEERIFSEKVIDSIINICS